MAKASNSKKITHATVRMYCMGTGDCFIVKFFSGDDERFKMMIDCGVWSGSSDHLRPYIENLKTHVKNSVDLLIITHEHTDHVSVFESCSDLFTNDFNVKRIWMGWPENDALSKVKRWKTEYGEKKYALTLAAKKLNDSMDNEEWKNSVVNELHAEDILGAKKMFAAALNDFAHLHAASGDYIGPLEGMKIVKKQIAKDNIEYFDPGDIIENMDGLDGVKFYVLGPPEKWSDVETEGGGEGESYTHNTKLKGSDAFAASILRTKNIDTLDNILPFDSIYEVPSAVVKKTIEEEKKKVEESKKDPTGAVAPPTTTLMPVNSPTKDPDIEIVKSYNFNGNNWRNIDNDWLFSAGSLALRMNSLTNNLSLALAVEFEESKRVMLFPGDAEYGSWSSWHKINWKGVTVADGKHFTQDLLRRTVFYKVAHHMSHNGTAQRLGLEMMDHKDLAAMATLDYNVIAPKWKNTMPNREMLQELLRRTRGRVMIMNDSNLFYDFKGQEPMPAKIKEAQKKMTTKETNEYTKSFKRDANNLFVEYTVQAK